MPGATNSQATQKEGRQWPLGVKVGWLFLLITLPFSSFLLPDQSPSSSLSLVPSLNCAPLTWDQTLPCVIRILSVWFLTNA